MAQTGEAADTRADEAAVLDEDGPEERIEALARMVVGTAQKQLPASVVPDRRPAPGLRTARVVALSRDRSATVALRGRAAELPATLAEEVDRELVARAISEGQSVLVEIDEAGELLVVGVVQTRVPDKLTIAAGTVTIEGSREVLLRSGSAALRLREDGDVELVGSRIVTMSRGLFRLVGRMLRLN